MYQLTKQCLYLEVAMGLVWSGSGMVDEKHYDKWVVLGQPI